MPNKKEKIQNISQDPKANQAEVKSKNIKRKEVTREAKATHQALLDDPKAQIILVDQKVKTVIKIIKITEIIIPIEINTGIIKDNNIDKDKDNINIISLDMNKVINKDIKSQLHKHQNKWWHLNLKHK